MARTANVQVAMLGGLSMSALPATKTNGYSGMSVANAAETKKSRLYRQYGSLEAMMIDLPETEKPDECMRQYPRPTIVHTT